MNGLLVVDDEEGVRRSLKRVLEKDGYRILLAENGREALDIIRNDNQEIETVICDYRMPGMDGLETLIEIGRMNTEITRIILTAYATMANAIEAVNAGIDGFLTKPFENEELRAKVRECSIKKAVEAVRFRAGYGRNPEKRPDHSPEANAGNGALQRHAGFLRSFRATYPAGALGTPQPPGISLPSTTSSLPTTGLWTSISGTASWRSSGRR